MKGNKTTFRQLIINYRQKLLSFYLKHLQCRMISISKTFKKKIHTESWKTREQNVFLSYKFIWQHTIKICILFTAFTEKKKESDDLGLVDIPSSHKENKDAETDMLAFSKAKAKPLTDLSKKAEEEVNHLTKSKGNSKTQQKEEKTTENKKAKVTSNEVLDNSTIIRQINATLEKLSASSPQNTTVSPKAYRRLVQRITQMSPKKSEAVQEAG